jgi:proline iminopeptidase
MRERVVAVNGAKLWVAEQGAGPPIVLCSGGAGLCDYLGPVAATVDDVAQVYRFDPRGCGRSSATPPYDMPTLLADLDALRSTMGHERWVVAGHSFGADLALAYALEHTARVRALVYISGTGVQDDRQWHAAYEAGRAAGRDPLPAFEYPFNPQVNQVANTSWREYIKHPLLLRRIGELRVPVLALYGSEDVRPSWPTQQLVHLLPNARYEVVEGAAHCLWLTHADDMRSRLRAFLCNLPDEGSRRHGPDLP